MSRARVIAFYLPQFHPIPENDLWWGKGFTEWTNVAKAKPAFKGHVQPKVPADLGFYDLRLPEVRKAQAEMARDAGVEGFCYWHYWFGNGKTLLEMPFNEVLRSGEPDFPFCLAWANHSWSNKTWQKNKAFQKDTMFMEQTYGDIDDYINHFNAVLPAFLDHRYIKVDGKPLFMIFSPFDFPNLKEFTELWNDLAKKNGLEGIYFVGKTESIGRFDKGVLHDYTSDITDRYNTVLSFGMDAVNSINTRRAEIMATGKYSMMAKRLLTKINNDVIVEKYDYKKIIENLFTQDDRKENIFPTIIPRFDKTPRVGKRACAFVGATPELFEKSVREAIDIVSNKEPEHRIIFLQAWNEWGEGNYMEPDLEFGHGFLDALHNALTD